RQAWGRRARRRQAWRRQAWRRQARRLQAWRESGRVPQRDDLPALAVAQDAERGDIEPQPRGDRDVRVDPGRTDRAKDVAVRECEDPALAAARGEFDEALCSGVDLGGCLAAGRTVFVQLPARVLLVDLLGGKAFVAAVVGLPE